jgi:hypothetical protein
MRSEVIVILSPSFFFSCVSSIDINQFAFRYSSRKIPLNDSMNWLYVGFQNLQKSKVTLFSYAQLSKPLLISSDQFCNCIRCGVILKYCFTPFMIPTTSIPFMDCLTVVARHWRLKLSTKVSTRNFLPLDS